MILNIKPIRTPALRMKEDIYASFLNYIGRDYMLLLSSSWGFRVNLNNVKTPENFEVLWGFIYINVFLGGHF